MIPWIVQNWTTRPLMISPSVVGTYVRVDPFDAVRDIPLLWEALGGNDGSIEERLKWFGEKELKESDFTNLLMPIEEVPGQCINVFRTPDTAKVVGMASYLATSAENGSTEVGYVAHGPDMAGTPAATEAHYILAKHAFDTMGYRRYEWKCDSNNLPSKRAAERYGFVYEGCFRHHRVTGRGTNRDTCWFSMIDKEWEERKKAMEEWLKPENFDADGKQKRHIQDFQSWRDS